MSGKVKKLDAVVLTTKSFERLCAFYRTLGIELEEERHGDGPLHYTCDLGPLHFAIFEAKKDSVQPPGRNVGGGTLISFEVENTDEVVSRLRKFGSKIEVDPEVMPWGRRAIVHDPDGRLIELNQPL